MILGLIGLALGIYWIASGGSGGVAAVFIIAGVFGLLIWKVSGDEAKAHVNRVRYWKEGGPNGKR